MNTQEYLSQVFYLDCRIKSKLEQIEQLRVMSAGTAVAVSDMPGSPNRNIHKLEDITVRLIAMENAAADAIDQLSKLKLEVREGKGSDAGWGRLKSGAGWVALDNCDRV